MISTEQIADFIAHPNHVKLEHVGELEILANKHPYAQLFSILTLKGLANEKDTRFDEILLHHSYRITDRVQLYNLVHQIDTINSLEQATNESIEVLATDEKTESDPQKKSTESIVEESTSEPAFELAEDENQTVETAPNLVIEEKEGSEITEVENEVDVDNRKEIIDPVLEENILHHVYANSFQLEELTPEEEEVLSKREEEKDNTKIIIEKNASTEQPISFSSWLHANKNYSPIEDNDTAAIHAVVNDFVDFDPLEDLTGEVDKPKQEFFSPAKKAKESLREETIPVSETLAKIYALQGNYPKAIEAYQQLSLNFPEKKIFFANLIKDLQKNLNT